MVSALNKKLWRDIMQLKGQVISIALVVCMGVAVLIGSISTYNSLSFAQKYFYTQYHFADIFASVKRAPIRLSDQINSLAGVAQTQTRIVEEVNLDLPDMNEPAIGRFISIEKNSDSELNEVFIRSGHLPDTQHNDQIVISEAFAKAHNFKPGNQLIAVVNGRRQTFHIVGIGISPEFIYTIRGANLMPDNLHFGVMWLNRKAMESAFDMEGAFNDISIRLAPEASADAVIAGLDRLLLPFGGLGAHGRSEQISHQLVSNEFRQLKFLATVIPAIFILIAGFLLNMVTGRLVALQREHIAILKSLGYSNFSVGLYYLKLVALIVFIGSLLGIGFGAWMGNAMTSLYKVYFVFPIFNYQLSPSLPFLGALISFIAASGGAATAVRWVVTLPPSVAMRPPTPPDYHTSILERWGILKKFSSAVKMIIRNIARNPFRNFSATVGVAAGVSIIIMGLFWNDAINHVINTQFMTAEREHVLVSFNDPVKDHVLFDLRKLPGVLAVEAFRVAPVRLRAKHRTYLTGLFGYQADSEQRILLDDKQQRIPIMKDEFLLSKALANILQVKPGETIGVEILEGKRQKFEVTLTRIVDDFIGLSAYTDYSTLNELLDEDRMISVASMIYDQKYEQDLYKKLKDMPKVATVTIKARLIKTFEETFANHLLVFTAFLTSFAMVIAIGIVYNSARISLSERAWELASLRVLGFTKTEVTRLLLGELSAQLIFGIPLGFYLGKLLAEFSISLIPAEVIRLPLIISASTYAYSALTILVAAFISAIIVRRHINKLDLVGVLKTLD